MLHIPPPANQIDCVDDGLDNLGFSGKWIGFWKNENVATKHNFEITLCLSKHLIVQGKGKEQNGGKNISVIVGYTDGETIAYW